jgi:hypothetical protein
MSRKRTSPQDRRAFAPRRPAQIVVAVTKITLKNFRAVFFNSSVYTHEGRRRAEDAGSLQRGSRLEQGEPSRVIRAEQSLRPSKAIGLVESP